MISELLALAHRADESTLEELNPEILATLEKYADDLEQLRKILSHWVVLEVEVKPWKHLVDRKLPHYRQLHIKGRNMSVRDVIARLRSDKWTVEETAKYLKLPAEAVEESIQYAEQNPAILEFDAAYEKFKIFMRSKSD